MNMLRRISLTGLFMFATLPAHALLGPLTNDINKISAGLDNTCAIVNDAAGSQVKCWGHNFYGQLGIGTSGSVVPVSNPMPVNLPNPEQISVGGHTTCVISKGNMPKLYCWGHGQGGGNGQGTTTDLSTPMPVPLPAGALPLQVSVGLHYVCTIVELNGRKLYCWGENIYGQVGNGTNTNQLSPVQINLGPGITPVQVDTGFNHTCAVVTGPGMPYHLKCWGKNQYGNLGIGTNTNMSTPQTVPIGAGMVASQVAAGSSHTCAIMAPLGGAPIMKCWGFNGTGQLGIGSTTTQNLPQFVAVSKPLQVDAGWGHTCARVMDPGSILRTRCWGGGSLGQVGVGNTLNYTTPQIVNLVGGLKPIHLTLNASYHSCALVSPAVGVFKLQCWGKNQYGQLGNGTSVNALTPLFVP